MKTLSIISATLLITTLSVSAQSDYVEPLKPYIYYAATVNYDETIFANGISRNDNGSEVLPVELKDFNIEVNNSTTTFTWSTYSETNASHFSIYITTPEDEEYTVDYIAASGNSNSIIEYSYQILNNFPEGSIAKLTQTDFDGKVHLLTYENIGYSTEKEVPVSDLVIVKNDGTFKVEWRSGSLGSTRVNIYSVDGRLLTYWEGNSIEGFNSSDTFSVAQNSPIIVTVECNGNRKTLKTIL